MPSTSIKQRNYFRAELGRAESGKQTRTGMGMDSLKDFAKGPVVPKGPSGKRGSVRIPKMRGGSR